MWVWPQVGSVCSSNTKAQSASVLSNAYKPEDVCATMLVRPYHLECRLSYCLFPCLQLATNRRLYKGPHCAVYFVTEFWYLQHVTTAHSCSSNRLLQSCFRRYGFWSPIKTLDNQPIISYETLTWFFSLLEGSCFKMRLKNWNCYELIERDTSTRSDCCRRGGFFHPGSISSTVFVRDILLGKSSVKNCENPCVGGRCLLLYKFIYACILFEK